jgi:hypothetical protein
MSNCAFCSLLRDDTDASLVFRGDIVSAFTCTSFPASLATDSASGLASTTLPGRLVPSWMTPRES